MIGCSDAALFNVMPLPARLHLLREAGFDCVDFSLYLHSLRPDSPMCGEQWQDWVNKTQRTIQQSGLLVEQMHCVFDAKLAPDLSWEKPSDVYYRSIEACAMMGCHRLIFHPLEHAFRMANEKNRELILQANADWFRLLIACASQNGVELHLENTFDFGNFQMAGDPVFPCATAADLIEIADRIDSPWVRFCLDTGHANIAGQAISDMIHTLGDRLNSLHLNDNYGQIYPLYSDLHLFPGFGRIEWKPFFDALREIHYDGILNIEPVAELRRSTPRICHIQLKAAADVLKELAFTI